MDVVITPGRPVTESELVDAVVRVADDLTRRLGGRRPAAGSSGIVG